MLDSDDLNGADAVQQVLRALTQAVDLAVDGLVVYFAGHGFRDPDSPELYLTLPLAEKEELYANTLPYGVMASRLLRSRARRRVVIIDCCYSGLALNGPMSAPGEPSDLAIEGTCVLTATPPTSRALAPPGERNSLFTGQLLHIMNHGVPDGPELLDMTTVYLWV